ncbi:solute carrier family 13 member 2-like [Centruroides vittatus]|uniref:solute carrier family 13 member 2-like n=1 Tax=Centruroides vittatus TaxID=120091 RepID=UPI00350F0CB6
MALYFVFEPVPIPVTAILPLILFPILGILKSSEVGQIYFVDTNVLTIGSLIMAAAVEYCNLHRRIALRILLLIGTSMRLLVAGFIVSSMFLSMWMMNTACSAMMVPIVDAIVDELEKDLKESETSPNKFEIQGDNSVVEENYNIRNGKYYLLRKALLLSVAYSATCGGTGTVIGTGGNLVLVGMLDTYLDHNPITFSNWMYYNIPGMLLCGIAVFIVLQLVVVGCRKKENEEEKSVIEKVIKNKYQELGTISNHEVTILIIYILLILTWFFRDPRFIDGWITLTSDRKKISNTVPVLIACMLLFLIPINPWKHGTKKPLLDWKTAEKKVPLGYIFLFGSGFAIAAGTQASGLSTWIANNLSSLNVLSPVVIVFVLCLATSFFTEIIINTSMATILLPIVYNVALAVHVHPLYLMLPVTISTSFAFMLPVGNPPCAIVYQAGNLKTSDLVKPGIILNFICVGLQLLMINTWGAFIYDFQPLKNVNSTEINI